VLDDRESAALDAVLAVVLPSTSGAGAAEADAGRYVRARLAGPDAAWLVPLRRWLAADVIGPHDARPHDARPHDARPGGAGVARGGARHGAADAGAPDGARVAAAVASLAAEADGPWPGLFEQVRLWAWSGYLCDPARGGNADGVGWQRFDWAPPAGRTHTAGGPR
jgi:hypothetical protein